MKNMTLEYDYTITSVNDMRNLNEGDQVYWLCEWRVVKFKAESIFGRVYVLFEDCDSTEFDLNELQYCQVKQKGN